MKLPNSSRRHTVWPVIIVVLALALTIFFVVRPSSVSEPPVYYGQVTNSGAASTDAQLVLKTSEILPVGDSDVSDGDSAQQSPTSSAETVVVVGFPDVGLNQQWSEDLTYRTADGMANWFFSMVSNPLDLDFQNYIEIDGLPEGPSIFDLADETGLSPAEPVASAFRIPGLHLGLPESVADFNGTNLIKVNAPWSGIIVFTDGTSYRQVTVKGIAELLPDPVSGSLTVSKIVLTTDSWGQLTVTDLGTTLPDWSTITAPQAS